MKNKKVILTVGIPASGKSTWAKDFIKVNPDYVRINRDSYREMMQGRQMLDFKLENAITNMVLHDTKSCLDAGYNVIIDQTNLKEKYLNQLIDFCTRFAEVSFRVFDIPLDVAIRRDNERNKSVGEDVVKRMYDQYLILVNKFDWRVRPKIKNMPGGRKDIYTYQEDISLPHCVIVDVDGTLANMTTRGPFDWNRVGEDEVNEPIADLVRFLSDNGKSIIIFTGRDGSCLEETKQWLDRHQIPFDDIFIRPEGNYQKDNIIKKNLFEENIRGKYFVEFVIDDRDQVIDMWRKELGITCLQVDYGNF